MCHLRHRAAAINDAISKQLMDKAEAKEQFESLCRLLNPRCQGAPGPSPLGTGEVEPKLPVTQPLR